MIRLERLSVRYEDVAALTDVNLDVEAGDLCVLVGPSGSGKSTLLRSVNRLVEPAHGKVVVRGVDVASFDPSVLRRSIGYVIQSVGLFPHRTVARNIATVPRLMGWSPERIAQRVEDMMALTRLEPALAQRYPAELSGGQAQRVGLARALASDPDILLLDEPFGAVDPITRRELRAELKRIHADTGKTIVLVTHDPLEALELASRIVVLREGRVVAAGRPQDFAAVDADAFVRELFGVEALALHHLRLVRVTERARPGGAGAGPVIDGEASLRDALVTMLVTGCSEITIRDSAGQARALQLNDILEPRP